MKITEEKQMTHTPKPGVTWQRQLLAFIYGVLYAVVLLILFSHNLLFSIVVSAFLVHLSMGIAAAFAVDKQNKHVITLSIWTGLVAWFGMGIVLLIWGALQEAAYAASCQAITALPECSRGEGWVILFVIAYLVISFVLVLLSALTTGFALKLCQKSDERETAHNSHSKKG